MNPPGNPSTKPLAYIVDDEPMLLDLNESVLRSIGFEVKRFRAAELALEAFRQESPPPAIIVTDYAMHKMTGIELIEQCRKIHPNQKVLLVSGTVTEAAFANAPMKPDQFMRKPYTLDEFAAAVQRMTARPAGN